MDWLFLIIGILSSGFGLWLWFQALRWRSKTRLVESEVIGFLKKRSRGKRIPVFKFLDESGIEVKSAGVIIDNLSFWLRPSQKGEIIDVLYFRSAPEKCVVHGYMNIVGGFFLQWPMILYLINSNYSAMALGQFSFIFILFGVLALMWLFLRIVRYYY